MVFLPWNPFNYVDEEGTEITKNRLIFKPQNGDVIGLRIITQHMYAGNKANVVVIKPSLRFQNPNCECFLKSCHLCDKELRLDKDVYMYSGDQGFCSVECRERQIYLDEMKEIEKSVKKFRIDQFKQRHKPFSSSKGRPIAVLL